METNPKLEYEAVWTQVIPLSVVSLGGRVTLTLYPDGRLRQLVCNRCVVLDVCRHTAGCKGQVAQLDHHIKHRPRKEDFEVYQRQITPYAKRRRRVERVVVEALDVKAVAAYVTVIIEAGWSPFEEGETDRFEPFAQSIGAASEDLAYAMYRQLVQLRAADDLHVAPAGTRVPAA